MTIPSSGSGSHTSHKSTSPTHNDPPATAVDVTDASRPAAKPQGSLQDQVATMESEGQAQPQADEVPPPTPTGGIPPLPSPDVEGVGNETGPSAAKTGAKGEGLTPEQAKQARDAAGF